MNPYHAKVKNYDCCLRGVAIGAMRIGWKGSRRLLLSLMSFASATLYGQNATQPDQVLRAKMDEVVRRCIREDGTPLASVTVVQGGRLVYSAAFGDAAMHPKTAATSVTSYQLASISTTFVAQSILLLEAEGKLSLDDPSQGQARPGQPRR